MDRDDEFYRAFIIAIVIGIFLTIIFIVYMKPKIAEREQFSELYFNEHKKLPHRLEINNTYNISFTISNHELDVVEYVYEIDSKVENLRKNITLFPEESAVIRFYFTPNDKGWELDSYFAEDLENKFDVLKDSIIAYRGDLDILLGNKSIGYMPISHNVPGIGMVYHTNISKDELKEKPFNKYYRYEDIGVNKSVYGQQNMTLFVKDDELYLRSHSEESIYFTGREPFIIKLYKEGSEKSSEQDIYFWYEVR